MPRSGCSSPIHIRITNIQMNVYADVLCSFHSCHILCECKVKCKGIENNTLYMHLFKRTFSKCRIYVCKASSTTRQIRLYSPTLYLKKNCYRYFVEVCAKNNLCHFGVNFTRILETLILHTFKSGYKYYHLHLV